MLFQFSWKRFAAISKLTKVKKWLLRFHEKIAKKYTLQFHEFSNHIKFCKFIFRKWTKNLKTDSVEMPKILLSMKVRKTGRNFSILSKLMPKMTILLVKIWFSYLRKFKWSMVLFEVSSMIVLFTRFFRKVGKSQKVYWFSKKFPKTNHQITVPKPLPYMGKVGGQWFRAHLREISGLCNICLTSCVLTFFFNVLQHENLRFRLKTHFSTQRFNEFLHEKVYVFCYFSLLEVQFKPETEILTS